MKLTDLSISQSVVSAMIEPDTIIIERSWENVLSIKEKTLGKKTHKISMTTDDGTITEELGASGKDELCISEDIALGLSKLGINLEALFGGARDIEWAVVQNEIFLLQARPVTALDTWTDFEIIHELDSPVPSEIDIWVFANVGEVFPGATSPLTGSTVIRFLNNAIEVSAMEQLANPYYENCVGSSSMRCCMSYMNVSMRQADELFLLMPVFFTDNAAASRRENISR